MMYSTSTVEKVCDPMNVQLLPSGEERYNDDGRCFFR